MRKVHWQDNHPKDNTPAGWQNRIVRYGDAIVDDLLANPFNARIHGQAQQAALLGVLDTVGLIDTICINERTGHLVDGHLRMVLAERYHVKTLPARWIDVDEHDEKLILASFDWITQLATYDRDATESLLQQIQADDERVQAMIADMAVSRGIIPDDFDLMQEWIGMPEFEQETIKSFHSLILHFKTEQDMRDFAVLVQQVVEKSTRYLYYPKQVRLDAINYRAIEDES